MDAGTCAIYLTHSASGILVRLGSRHSRNDQTQSQQRHNVRPTAISLHGDLVPGQPSRLLVFQAHAEIYFTFCDTAARDILGKFSAIQKLSRNGLGGDQRRSPRSRLRARNNFRLPVIRSESVAGTRVHVASMSRLFRKESTATDPEFCEGLEILLVTASNCVFLPTFNAETILSRRVRLDLYHERGIHERRSMNPNESVR